MSIVVIFCEFIMIDLDKNSETHHQKIVIKNQNNLRNPIKYSIFMNLSKKDDIKDVIPVFFLNHR